MKKKELLEDLQPDNTQTCKSVTQQFEFACISKCCVLISCFEVKPHNFLALSLEAGRADGCSEEEG